MDSGLRSLVPKTNTLSIRPQGFPTLLGFGAKGRGERAGWCCSRGALLRGLWAEDSLAEWSKAVAQGAIPQGRGFEPHSCHCCFGGTLDAARHRALLQVDRACYERLRRWEGGLWYACGKAFRPRLARKVARFFVMGFHSRHAFGGQIRLETEQVKLGATCCVGIPIQNAMQQSVMGSSCATPFHFSANFNGCRRKTMANPEGQSEWCGWATAHPDSVYDSLCFFSSVFQTLVFTSILSSPLFFSLLFCAYLCFFLLLLPFCLRFLVFSRCLSSLLFLSLLFLFSGF